MFAPTRRGPKRRGRCRNLKRFEPAQLCCGGLLLSACSSTLSAWWVVVTTCRLRLLHYPLHPHPGKRSLDFAQPSFGLSGVGVPAGSSLLHRPHPAFDYRGVGKTVARAVEATKIVVSLRELMGTEMLTRIVQLSV